MKRKIFAVLISLLFSSCCYAIDVKAIKTNEQFEEVARIDKLEQIKISTPPTTAYTPKNLKKQQIISFQGRNTETGAMTYWSSTFTDYDTKIISSEIIDQTYYIYDNLGNQFATGEHVDLAPINSAVNQNTQDIQNLNQRLGGYDRSLQRIEDRVDNVERSVYAGLATVTALTSLHPNPRSNGLVDVSVGTGVFRDQCAGAAGIFVHPTDNLMIQGGAAFGSENSWAGYAGLTFSFGKRK